MKLNRSMAIVFLIILSGSIYLYFPPIHIQKVDYYGENFSIDLNEFADEFEKPSFFNFLRKISSPFEFKFFDLSLKPIENKDLNNCSYLDIGTIYQNFENKSLQIEAGKKNFIDTIKIDKYYFGNASVTYNINYSKPNDFNCDLIVDFKTIIYVEMNVWDALGNILILFVFYSGVFLLFLEIKKRIMRK